MIELFSLRRSQGKKKKAAIRVREITRTNAPTFNLAEVLSICFNTVANFGLSRSGSVAAQRTRTACSQVLGVALGSRALGPARPEAVRRDLYCCPVASDYVQQVVSRYGH